jgi:hypothetical protein
LLPGVDPKLGADIALPLVSFDPAIALKTIRL